ncbi:MAG TPA: SEC-C metal-binding domain-containing protein [Tepidisphaeraceae bacterium]|jgi:hypothetical protein
MDHAQIARDYKALRQVSFRLGKSLVERFSRDDIDAAARELGMLHDNKIVLETEDELGVVLDYAIYAIFRDGRNAVDRMLEEEPPPEGSPEMRVLRAMKDSHYTILDVQEVIPGVGVRGLDGPKHVPILVVDMGFSQTATTGMALATRILSPAEGWWMTSGAALPVNQQALELIDRDWSNHTRRSGHEPDDRNRARIITRACIAAGASRQIAYANVRDSARLGRLTPTAETLSKVGRNDPCPCGSAKKYKKCCGMFPGRPRQ